MELRIPRGRRIALAVGAGMDFFDEFPQLPKLFVRNTFRRQLGDHAFQFQTQLHNIAHMLDVKPGNNGSHAGNGFDEVFLLQTDHDLAHGKAPDTVVLHDLLFFEQLAGLELRGDDVVLERRIKFVAVHNAP